jgi:hypothetical protein
VVLQVEGGELWCDDERGDIGARWERKFRDSVEQGISFLLVLGF